MDTHTPGASAPMQAVSPAIFQFGSTEVRTVDRDGQVWFVAGDVAKALNYADAVQMTRVLDEDEKGLHTMQTLGGNQQVTIISESGLYHALLKSRKPQARPFRRWVTQEVVLPAIRQDCTRQGSDQVSVLGQRWLLHTDERGQWQSRSIQPQACVIDPQDPDQLAVFLREYVPVDGLGEVLAICAQRLLKNRHHPGNQP
jgi:prophage antirepressor-like protein